MKLLCTHCLGLAWVFVLACGVGCGRTDTPPPTLSAEELPAALEKAFVKAKPEVKELAGAIAGSARNRDYPGAYVGLQTLSAKPGLKKEQQQVLASALVTVNGLLQTAQSQGDPKAAQMLNYLRATK